MPALFDLHAPDHNCQMYDFSPFIELSGNPKAIPSEADLLVEVDSYQWLVSSEKLCHHSEFFQIACVPGRFQEGRERRVVIRETNPWTVARVIQWCYSQTFDQICTNKILSRQSNSHSPQTLHQVTDAEAYGLDHEEDALSPTYKVSAEVYQLAHRLFIPELCKYVATEMLERYRPMLFTSWPLPVFDTLAQASNDDIDFRAVLCEALAIQTFLEPLEYPKSPRLKSLMEDDPEFIFELMHQKDRLTQTYRESAKRLAVARGSDEMLTLELELWGQFSGYSKVYKAYGRKRVTIDQCGHACAGVPVLNIFSGGMRYWHGHRWVEHG